MPLNGLIFSWHWQHCLTCNTTCKHLSILPETKTSGTTPLRCWIMCNACSSRSKFFLTIIFLNKSKSSPAQTCSKIDYTNKKSFCMFLSGRCPWRVHVTTTPLTCSIDHYNKGNWVMKWLSILTVQESWNKEVVLNTLWQKKIKIWCLVSK